MRDSLGEIKIFDILTEAGIPFAEEYTFPDLVSSSGRFLRFDFCIFDDLGNIDFLIEYQGAQHYKAVGKFGGYKGVRRQQYNDAKKREYCLKHGLKLITIPYWDESKITYDYIMSLAGY